MDPFSLTALYLYVTTFGVAWFSGIFGMGGGMILLAVMTLFTPLDVLVPLHGMLLVGNITTRLFLNRQSIQWQYVGLCSVGLLLGTGIGAALNVAISPAIFSICLGLVLLSFIWMPVKGEMKIPMFPAGLVHGTLASLFGTGGVLQAVFTRLPLTRHETIATFSALMLFLVFFKIVTFIAI